MRTTFFLSTIIAMFLISSCDTKVDLIEEGLETSVVFGFMDPTVDTQFVKITKTFVTEGSAVDSAQDPGLSEYNNLAAYVIEYDDDHDSVNSYLLQEKIVTDKDSGAWYYPVQTVYFFTEIVNFDYTYEIGFTGSGNDVISSTDIVGAYKNDITTNLPEVKFVDDFEIGATDYHFKGITVKSSRNTKRYEFTYRYHYKEIYTDGSEKDKVMSFKKAPWVVPGSGSQLDGTDVYDGFAIDGEGFYQAVAGRILAEDNEANVERRVIGKIDFIFEYAGEDFNTFIELSEPSTSLNVEQNPYSNITNAIGVWSSRGITTFLDKSLTFPSVQEMALGQYTGELHFCSDDPGHVGTSWGCN
ncbi:MAG: hypothetical protein DRI54_04715 [Bacteroidetes bacterium]|nr:MAG: hypothetical protein DRI54_04715 [Bacteroidota bacterium]